MVLQLLKIKADLENLTDLAPTGSSDGSEFTFYFKVKCGNCGAVNEKLSSVTVSELVDIPRSRGKANLVQKCKVCDRTGNISILEGRNQPYTIDDSEAEKFVPIACFDCRGIEPVDFHPKDGWTAEALSGAKFNDIDLSDGEFAEYDEKGSAAVSICNIEHKFEVTK